MSSDPQQSAFVGKHFQVISKLNVRYTGIFHSIDPTGQTVMLAEVYNHGTENRQAGKFLPGSNVSIGWVRFHTNDIRDLSMVNDGAPPGQQPPEIPSDPALASVSRTAPPAAAPTQPRQLPAPRTAPPPQQPAAARASPSVPSPASSGPPAPAPSAVLDGMFHSGPTPPAPTSKHDLPAKPSASSFNTTLDRVQQSLSQLSTSNNRSARSPPGGKIEVPDTEFDFSKGTEKFEAEREARKGKAKESSSVEEVVGEPENEPHPSAISSVASPRPGPRGANGKVNGSNSPAVMASNDEEANGESGGKKASSAYSKSSFFDNLSGETSRVSRNEERHRNFDTFGEAGGEAYAGRGRGGFGQRGGGGRGRGTGEGYGGGTAPSGYGGYSGRGRGGGGGGGGVGPGGGVYGGYGVGPGQRGGGFRGRGRTYQEES